MPIPALGRGLSAPGRTTALQCGCGGRRQSHPPVPSIACAPALSATLSLAGCHRCEDRQQLSLWLTAQHRGQTCCCGQQQGSRARSQTIQRH
jgi:hypothetical protein